MEKITKDEELDKLAHQLRRSGFAVEAPVYVGSDEDPEAPAWFNFYKPGEASSLKPLLVGQAYVRHRWGHYAISFLYPPQEGWGSSSGFREGYSDILSVENCQDCLAYGKRLQQTNPARIKKPLDLFPSLEAFLQNESRKWKQIQVLAPISSDEGGEA